VFLEGSDQSRAVSDQRIPMRILLATEYGSLFTEN